MRKLLLGILTLSILVLLVVTGYVYWSGKTVEVGMAENEVEEILGGPGLRHKFRNEDEMRNLAESMEMNTPPPRATMKLWSRNQGAVFVVFDSGGKVASVRYPRGGGRILNMLVQPIGG